MEKFSRYFHTLRHLKPRQMAYRVIRRLSRPSLPQRRGPVQRRCGVSLKPVIPRTMALTDEFAFRFLNEERRFSPETIDWHPAAAGKLWCYNLHYFDYLQEVGRSRESARILVDSWITSNAPGTVDAWEPFPLSLRIVNWIKYFLASGKEATVAAPWLDSLYDQTLWLEQSIEYHLLANHYFKNGKALIFAGLFFAGNDADRWLRKGLKIISEELGEQILPDGGHFERSPMYHAMILEDCLDLLNLCRKESRRDLSMLAGRLRGVTVAMTTHLLGMRHPDGEIALFNDAAIGIEAAPAELSAYCQRLTELRVPEPSGPCWSFPDTGYHIMAPVPGNRLIIDCGPVGPDYLPGHSHCDTLSFELSLAGQRVIVDSGCCRYVDGDIRRYNRGNAGHNTLTIDGADQTEVWGAHRCARRARPLYARLERRPDGSLRFEGGHDGYRRLPGSPVHHRAFTWSGSTLAVDDRVEGRGSHDIELRLHIHPACTVKRDGDAILVSSDERPLAVISTAGAILECDTGWYSPRFGIRLPCPVLRSIQRRTALPFRGGWRITVPPELTLS